MPRTSFFVLTGLRAFARTRGTCHSPEAHTRDTRGLASLKEEPIMSQLDELYGDATIALALRGANIACHGNPPTSPTSQDVRL